MNIDFKMSMHNTGWGGVGVRASHSRSFYLQVRSVFFFQVSKLLAKKLLSAGEENEDQFKVIIIEKLNKDDGQ